MSDGRPWNFADYKIRDILDVDLVSTTYRATTIDGDVRRLRVFTAEVASDERADAHAAVIAEARRARSVRHPHILSTHDVGQHSDRVYVVSDDINGAVLRDFIAQRQPLEPSTALAMGWQLAEALDAVHASGNVHGSINPHTIWVADSPGSDVPMTYLTGFGSARALAQYVKNQDGAPVCDDLLYVGPDQITGQRPSPEADRYALACAVYQLMTGTPPYRRGSINALFGAHLFAAVEPPTTVRGDLPPALDSVFLRALAKQTSDRYPSAYALMIAVERALRGQREQAAPKPPGDGFAAVDRTRSGAIAPANQTPSAEPSSADRFGDAALPGDVDLADDADLTADAAADDTVDPREDDGAHTRERETAGEGDTAGSDEDDTVDVIPSVDDTDTLPPAPDSGGAWPRPSTALRAPDDRGAGWATSGERQWAVGRVRASASEPAGGDPGSDLTALRAAPANGEATIAAAADLLDGTGTLDETDRLESTETVGEPHADDDSRAFDDSPAFDTSAFDDTSPHRGTGTLSEPDMLKGTGTLDGSDQAGRSGGAIGEPTRMGEPGHTSESTGAGALPEAGGLASRLEARRATRLDHGTDTRPRVESLGRGRIDAPVRVSRDAKLPPWPPTVERDAPTSDRGWSWSSARELLETRRGVLMAVAGALVIAVLGSVAVAMLRGGAGDAGTQQAAVRGPEADAQPDRDTQPATIRPRWTASFGNEPIQQMEVTDDAVLVAAGTTVGALEPSNGAQRWSHRTLAEVADVAALRDVMIVYTRDRVTGYDARTGALRWTLTDEVAGAAALVAGREQVYTVARDASGLVVSAIDPANGEIELLTTIAEDTVASDRAGRTVLGFDPSEKKGGPTLYVLTRDALHALDPQDGTVRWSAPVSGGGEGAQGQEPHLLARPWIESFDVAGGASFVVGRDGGVCRYASDSGEQVWTICEKFPVELEQAPALDARGGRVIVAGNDAVAAFDFTTGKLLWDQTTPDQPSSAVASGPKLAYVAREEGLVEAIDHESGRVHWRAPDAGDVTALTADAEGVYAGAADGSIVRLLEQNVAKVDVQ